MTALTDVLPGTATFVWAELPTSVRVDGLVGREIILERLGPTLMATYIGPDGTIWEFPVTGRTLEDGDALHTVVTEDSQVIACVHALDEGGASRRWLHLRVYEIVGRFGWGRLRIGADEAALASVRGIAGSKEVRGWRQALAWLERKFLFPEPPGRPSPLSMSGGAAGSDAPRTRRMVAIVSPNQDISAPVSCRLVGDGIVATLREVEKGEWRLRQIHRESRPVRDHERIALLHVQVEIFDATVKAGLKRMMRDELARLDSGDHEQTFMAIWRRYHQMENRYALNRMAELGFLEYTRWSYLDDAEDVIQFEIAGGRGGLLARLREEVAAGDEPELECTVQLPEVLGGSTRIEQDSGLLDIELVDENEVGSVIRVDVEQRFLEMRMVRRGKDTARLVTPPPQGFLHAAVRGDHRRLDRRSRALQRLLDGRIPLPQLLPLLQGSPARGKARPAVKPRSLAADECFGSQGPNEEQTLALDRALNTPDIAVIQGPPGTGKTQFIAALQVRLAEEGRKHAVVSHSMLLTSYQHAAVDNLIERSKVWDLPSIKIDSQNRGSTTHIENWRLTTIRALREDLSTPDGRRTMVMREVARQTADYCRAPLPTDELLRRLDDIGGKVAGLVSDELLGQLTDITTELRAAARVAGLQADHRRESALRAARGIRYLPVSFQDDGPEMAESALHRLGQVPVAEEAHLELLRRAADWIGDEPPFLHELAAVRDELLDRLTEHADRLFRPAAREDVVDLLNAIVDDLDARRRETAEGTDAALLEYLEELEGDPEAVLATLRMYTTSLGATCQQADSRAVRDVKDGERLFDTVIVDEAARANPLDLLIPLTLASRRVILVGDQNQLPHMLEPDVERELRAGADNMLATLRQSLFGRLFTLLHSGDTTPGPRRAVRLRRQYRMHPVLGEFVGRSFYESGLASPRQDPESFAHRLDRYEERPAAWLRVPRVAGHEHGGQSKARQVEAEAIAHELRRHALARPDLTFGVITFYSAQVQLIWEQLHKVGLAEPTKRGYRPVDELRHDADGEERVRLHIGTVDAFQGKQFDIVLLSVTRSSRLTPRPEEHPGRPRYDEWARRTYGHLMLSNRLCVAMSRQQRLLVVVGDDEMFTSPFAPESVAPLRDFHRMCAPPSGVTLSYDPGATR